MKNDRLGFSRGMARHRPGFLLHGILFEVGVDELVHVGVHLPLQDAQSVASSHRDAVHSPCGCSRMNNLGVAKESNGLVEFNGDSSNVKARVGLESVHIDVQERGRRNKRNDRDPRLSEARFYIFLELVCRESILFGVWVHALDHHSHSLESLEAGAAYGAIICCQRRDTEEQKGRSEDNRAAQDEGSSPHGTFHWESGVCAGNLSPSLERVNRSGLVVASLA